MEKSYGQITNVDHRKTFASMAKLTIISMLLNIVTYQGWHFHQLDINNALFNGDLFKDVYMSIPFGFVGKKENQVCKMHKSIYGIKQDSQQWFINLSSAFKSNMFH